MFVYQKNSKCIQQKLKGDLDRSKYSWKLHGCCLSKTDRTTRQKMGHIEELYDTINQQSLIDTYRTTYPTAAGYTFFSSAHGTFTKIDHVLGHKMNLKDLKFLECVLTKRVSN